MSRGPFAALLAAVVATVTGCSLYNSPRNRPGHIDLATPPAEVERQVTYPRDPGERVLIVNGGIFGGGGPRWQRSRSVEGARSLGFEATVKYGENAVSQANGAGSLGPVPFLLPPRLTAGLNLGWSWLDGEERGRVGPVYIEAQGGYSLLGLAAGYVVEPRPPGVAGTISGFQSTLFAGPFFMRVSHYPGQRTDLFFGALIKLEARFRWSR